MPRTSRLESPGCPPLRVLTSDVFGLTKVTESRGKSGMPKVVETWGSPDASRGILAASFAQDRVRPLFTVARKDGSVELRNPLNGDILSSFIVHEIGSDGQISKDDVVVGLHAFKWKQSESGTLLFCTENRKACLKPVKFKEGLDEDSPNLWDVCAAGKILCSSLDGDESRALFAGKGVEVNLWDLDTCHKIWTAKSPPANSLGIFTPTWFTAASFLSKNDHRKIVAGTNSHQIRLYDSASQRRPVLSVDFRESSIRSIAEDVDGHTVHVGTGAGDLASFDFRTGKLLGCFIGKCCGSIKSIARHPQLPVLASCGLDGYLRLWDTGTRQPLSAVFLKQHLTHLAFDSNFSDEEVCATGIPDVQFYSEIDDLEETQPGEGAEKEEEEPAAAVSGRHSNGKKAGRPMSRRKRSEVENEVGRAGEKSGKMREKKGKHRSASREAGVRSS